MLPHGHAERSCGELLCGAGGASEVVARPPGIVSAGSACSRSVHARPLSERASHMRRPSAHTASHSVCSCTRNPPRSVRDLKPKKRTPSS
jgi:hypothetical protein